MQVSKQQAVALLGALGYKAAKAMSMKRLQDKINKISDVADDDTEVEDEEMGALLKDVLGALSNEEAVEVVEDEEEGEEEATESAPKPPKAKKASGGRGTKGRPYFAGQVIRDYGLDVTPEMVEQVDIRCGKPNSKESDAWLKLARKVVLGYTSKKDEA